MGENLTFHLLTFKVEATSNVARVFRS